MPTHFAADGCAMPGRAAANDDRAADLIAAYEAGLRGDLPALGEIADCDDDMILVGHAACAVSGALIGGLIGYIAGAFL